MRAFRRFLKELKDFPYKENLNNHKHEKAVCNLLDTKYKSIKYEYQPNGSQRYPDFHFIEDGKGPLNQDLDLKSCKNSGKPMFNSGMPHSDGLYVFTTKKYGNTLFFGEDILSESVRNDIMKGRKEIKKVVDRVNKRIRKNPDNDRGWNIYFRPDFNNKGEDCNYFTHPRKIELEENVLDYYGE
jgi:hypothetical protein